MMVDINSIKEKYIEKYPNPVSLEGTKIILGQMRKNVCKIFSSNGKKGTAFFCKINTENDILYTLITTNHIIDEEHIKNNKLIKLSLNDNDDINIDISDKRRVYTNKLFDITIIEIFPEKDKIKNFMDLDERLFKNNSKVFYEKTSAYIIHYPENDFTSSVSYGIIEEINDYGISHLCNTKHGSSGSPILNLLNNKIIGIHIGALTNSNLNIGTFLKFPINEYISSIKQKEGYDIILKQMKETVCRIYNKELRCTGFLCNIPFPDKFNLLPVLATFEPTILLKDVEVGKTIEFSLDNEKKYFKITIEHDRMVYFCENNLIAFVEIKEKDGLRTKKFLDIDEPFERKILYEKKPIYCLHYPSSNKVELSNGIIVKVSDTENFIHNANFSDDYGTSGGPILSSANNKVIGMQWGMNQKLRKRCGNFIFNSIKSFYKKYDLMINKIK